MKNFFTTAAVLLLLAACGSQPPAPDWKLGAEAASRRATEAYLRGEQRVAELQWQKAREEVRSTADIPTAARLELMRCAAQVAGFDWSACSAYEALAHDAGEQQQAYARYLQAELRVEDVALLPPAQQPLARLLASADGPLAGASARAAIEAIADPLSRLVALAVALRSGVDCPTLLEPALDTASQQGWRRPLMAWLLLQRDMASGGMDQPTAGKAAMRLQLLMGGATAEDLPRLSAGSSLCTASRGSRGMR